MQFRSVSTHVIACLFFLASTSANAAERWVIEFKDSSAQTQLPVSAESADVREARLLEKLAVLSTTHKKKLSLVRPFGERAAVVNTTPGADPEQFRLRLLSDPMVRSVAVDRRVKLHAQSPLVGLLNALDLTRQNRSWFHQDVSVQAASINTGAMWANFHGSAPTVVAVLDTGVLPSHPMLQGHLLPGYDFVADPLIGADGQSTGGNSRDADPTDPGDGVTPTDLAADSACSGVSRSSWHGTFVSGLLAGNPIPAEGVFSVNWNASVLPVRVLGKCGGFSTDLADGIRWAAGLSVPGVPSNPFPAKVINLSLGAEGVCVAPIEGAAIAAARQAGSLVIVAAGNDGGTVDSPANCPGAFGVAAIDQEGLKANYSNFGSSIQLVAPGGDAAFPIWSASNTGLNAPLTNTYNTKIGTSFSAPMVAAAASLYWSLNPAASVSDVENALRFTARPFISMNNRPVCNVSAPGVECNCTTSLCGAGMLDVANLVNSVASGGLTNLFSNTGNVIPPGQSRSFSAIGSTNSMGQEVSAMSFDLINVIKSSSAVANPVLSVAGLQADITAPTGVLGFDLRAQTSNGRAAVASVVVQNQGATSPTLLASLLSPLINGAAAGVGGPALQFGDSVVGGSDSDGSSGNLGGTGGTVGTGGGGSLSLFGLLFLMILLKYNVRSTAPIRDIAQW
ncbi:S8 family peptidase [Limnobacter parvus]|uniref:S8 family peptidase n=1 Tax=Limnobacter parvus TaxID=2939690 RepID=A0ABT1XJ73_9BURK|nr:S8 family peptidase [Limnobacter parvus]MCR2746941.1 S8 family peptidase [Limnobacter parvus]